MDAMDQRRDAIVAMINRKGDISFGELKKAFPDVSEMTLRTDLKKLDEAKRIIRIHGGAKSVQVVLGTDDFLNKRSFRNVKEKQTIAEKALRLVKPDTTIYIDSGSSTTAFARIFPDQSNIIYTTGLSCVTELANLENPIVNIPGGKLNRYSVSVCGTGTVRELQQVNFDQVFMGTTCYEDRTGFTCGSREEAILKKTVIENSVQVIMLMDSFKLGHRNPFTICSLDEVDILVSDGKLPADFLEACEKHNVEVL